MKMPKRFTPDARSTRVRGRGRTAQTNADNAPTEDKRRRYQSEADMYDRMADTHERIEQGK